MTANMSKSIAVDIHGFTFTCLFSRQIYPNEEHKAICHRGPPVFTVNYARFSENYTSIQGRAEVKCTE